MYNKLFNKILDSSVWMENDSTRLVWFTFLAAMDEDGFAPFASPMNVAHRARVPIEATEEAIKVLEGPDKHSADPDNEGRRIERVDGGWMVLNAPKYNEIASRQNMKEKTRQRVAKYRERNQLRSVTQCNASVTPSDTDTNTDKVPPKGGNRDGGSSGKKSNRKPGKKKKSEPCPEQKEFINLWESKFEDTFGSRYVFQREKDGVATNRLVKSSGKSPQQLVDLAVSAWNSDRGFDEWEKGQVVTIAGFASLFNRVSAKINGKMQKVSANFKNNISDTL